MDDLEYDSEYKLIHDICDYCDLKIIKYVVDLGVNLECKDKFQHRPIHCISQRNLKNVKIFCWFKS